MEKLFSDKETYTKERPTKITAEQENKFYKEIAEEIIKYKWSDSDVEDIMEDISKITLRDNGYEIAKSLEGSRNKAEYEIDVEFCEFLENIGWKKDTIHRNNVKDWVKANNPQPKFKDGQKLMIDISLNYHKKKGMIVYVNGHSETEAYYLIDENPEKNGGTVVVYETAEKNCTPIN